MKGKNNYKVMKQIFEIYLLESYRWRSDELNQKDFSLKSWKEY